MSETIADEGVSTEQVVTDKLESDRLKELLEELPELQRETFVLKVAMDLTFEEIGKAMSCSTNTAKSRYRYALSAVRSLVKRQQVLEKVS